MMNTSLPLALTKQIKWIKTWQTETGGFNGYVVHRHDLKRMYRTHDTSWSQAPIINGFLNLYKSTFDISWLNEAIKAADLQCYRQCKNGSYTFAGFEDDRFSSLVHNSLSNCALLDLAKILINKGNKRLANKYIKVVKSNIDNYLIDKLWNNKFGAFKFSEIDYYSPNVTRYVVNMNSVAAESLIKLSAIIENEGYLDYALRIGEWILTEQISSQDIRNGGINYSQVQPDTLISIYTALAMRGLDDLFYATNDNRYLEMMVKASKHLMNLIDPNTMLFNHSVIKGELVKFPQPIAGAGIILKALDDTEKLSGIRYSYDNVLEKILLSQLSNGGFKNFVGYNTLDNYRISGNGELVWEDIVPVVGWNAHLFEFLTRKIEGAYKYDPNIKVHSNIDISKNYIYLESCNFLIILGFRPFKSQIILVAYKDFPVTLYLSPKVFIIFMSIILPQSLKKYVNNHILKPHLQRRE